MPSTWDSHHRIGESEGGEKKVRCGQGEPCREGRKSLFGETPFREGGGGAARREEMLRLNLKPLNRRFLKEQEKVRPQDQPTSSGEKDSIGKKSRISARQRPESESGRRDEMRIENVFLHQAPEKTCLACDAREERRGRDRGIPAGVGPAEWRRETTRIRERELTYLRLMAERSRGRGRLCPGGGRTLYTLQGDERGIIVIKGDP